MKKIFSNVAACMALIFCITACSPKNAENTTESSSSSVESSSSADSSVENPEEDSGDSSADSGDDDEGDGDGGGTVPSYTYTAFTAAEKSQFVESIGEVIPFLANNEYYIEEYSYDYGDEQESGINFYTYGNTQEEYNAYLQVLNTTYNSTGTEEDEEGDTWYFFDASDYYIDVCYYETEERACMDLYAYVTLTGGGNEDEGDGDQGGSTGSSYAYTDFTSSEKTLIIGKLGEVIPFVPNNEYYVDDYYEDYGNGPEDGINYYTYGNTQADFSAYLQVLNATYEKDGTDEDEYGDKWYFFSSSDYYINVSYYQTDEGDYCIDLYAYVLDENGGNTGGGNEGEWDDFEDDNQGGNQGGSDENITHLTNDGKGLPAGTNGVHNVDFTKAKYAKNVTEQGYYLDGCPTVGKPTVLVIPVEFSDATAASKGYTIENIEKAFNGGAGTTDYYSVHDYYYQSSYGKLDVQFTVLDSWFRPQYSSSYYASQTMDMGDYETECGDQMVIDEALAYLSKTMDLSDFDSDDNGTIDAIVVINTLKIDETAESIFHWAYRYWNMYTDDNGDSYEYDGVSANDYLWAPYQFLYENGSSYNDKTAMNTYTFIHEFGHVLGSDDYYDTAYVGSPLDGNDIMDSGTGDHNAYTKFNYGWLTTSRLVTASSSVTLTLDAFAENGDSILIANNWDDELGAYQEYFLVVYYTNDGLNSGVGGYFSEEGILVYHVNSSLYKEIYEGETYYDVYNNNTDPSDPDGYGTEDNLIELVSAGNGSYIFEAGDSLSSSTKDSQGTKIAYTFTVDSLTGDSATLTFTKNA